MSKKRFLVNGQFLMMRTGTAALQAGTKIVATIGPACRAPGVLAELVEKGVDVFRINTAHGDRAEHDAMVDDIRRLSGAAGRPIAILVDLAGPKIRLGQLHDEPVDCPTGAEFRFVRGPQSRAPAELVSNYERLIDELSVGDRVMLADGTVSMVVVAKAQDEVRCRVVNGGVVRSRQGINLPGTVLSVAALTESDREHALWAAARGADFIGISFVRSAGEIEGLRDLLDSQGSAAQVIAKIEKREALDRLEEIVAAADGVMVARGDLGVEIDVAETPVAQKRIIALCQQTAKPVIVATQMLDSMQHSRRPTRAEVSDVANAILDGADACMLSGETAIGQFPVEAVEMMNRVMLSTESMLQDRLPQPHPVAALPGVHPITSATVSGASRIASQLRAKLMVITTRTGATARVKAKHRDFIPVVGVSDSDATLRRMCLYWGVTPLPGAPAGDGEKLREFIIEWGRAQGCISRGDRIVYITGSDVVAQAHNVVVVQEVE